MILLNQKFVGQFLLYQMEYSFVFSPSRQVSITHKFNDTKIDIENERLLNTCKKYIKAQKNGLTKLIF